MARSVHAPQSCADLPLFAAPAAQVARDERRRVLAAVEQRQSPTFGLDAAVKILAILRERGRVSGEELVTECREAGIVPASDDRAFGPVFAALSRSGRIQKAGFVERTKGHSTAGGIVWALGPRA